MQFSLHIVYIQLYSYIRDTPEILIFFYFLVLVFYVQTIGRFPGIVTQRSNFALPPLKLNIYTKINCGLFVHTYDYDLKGEKKMWSFNNFSLDFRISSTRRRYFFCQYLHKNKKISENMLRIYSCDYDLSIHAKTDIKNLMLVSL